MNQVCTVCGIEETSETHTVSYYLPGNKGYMEPTVYTYIKGTTITLPTASDDNVIGSLTFAGWHVGIPGENESIITGPGEQLVAAGTEYTVVDEDLSFAARYDYIRISLADNAHNGEILSRYNGKETSDITLQNRTFYKDDTWNTLCLPFSLKKLDNTPLKDATVKTLESTSFDSATGTLTMNFSESSLTSIEAGKPYIVKWDSGEEIANPVFHAVIISTKLNPVVTMATESAPEGTEITFAEPTRHSLLGWRTKHCSTSVPTTRCTIPVRH